MSKKTRAQGAEAHRRWEQRQTVQAQSNGAGYSQEISVIEVPYTAISRGNIADGGFVDVPRRTMQFPNVPRKVIVMIKGDGNPLYFAARVQEFNKGTRFTLGAEVNYGSQMGSC